MILIILLFSFYLEGILSIIININFLLPLTTLVSLIIIYPYLFGNRKIYYLICFITGILYDISYTNTLFLNAFTFLLLGFIISFIYLYSNTLKLIIITIIIIVLYRFIIYGILVFIDYTSFNIMILLRSILYSLLFNIIYILLMFKITDILSRKNGIYKID